MTTRWKFHVMAQAVAVFFIVDQLFRLCISLAVEYFWPDYNPTVRIALTFIGIWCGVSSARRWVDREKKLLMDCIRRMHGQ